MKERPILFNGAMVRAILDGRKTQTRRIVRPQPVMRKFHPNAIAPAFIKPQLTKGFNAVGVDVCNNNNFAYLKNPLARKGDRLWVKETFCVVNDDDERWIDYRATPRYEESHPAGWENAPDDPDALKWESSIHMPRWASRINLEVIDVRVERLQDITEEAAMAEGVQRMKLPSGYQAAGNNMLPMYKQSFAYQWDTSNKKRGFAWEVNPYVWVIEFTRI